MNDKIWLSVFNEDEINQIKNSSNHQLNKILNMQTEEYFTIKAIEKIIQHNKEWLLKKKSKLLCNNFYNINGTLGEIRAYGNMLNAGFNIKPYTIDDSQIKKQNFDFIVNDNIEIEVYSPQINKDELDNIRDFQTENNKHFKAISVAPFGQKIDKESGFLKDGYTTTKCAIHKIFSSKGEHTQFSENEKNIKILWIDFQSDYIKNVINTKNSYPLRSWGQSINSGEIWHGFYGKKGFPAIEGDTPINTPQIEDDGMFFKSKAPDYAILSLKNDTIVLENHNSVHKLEDSFIFNKIFKLDNFNLQNSFISFADFHIKEVIALQSKYIENFYKIYADIRG